MPLPGPVAPGADLGVLAVSFPETRSVREETFVEETEAVRDELAEASCALEFRAADEAQLLDEKTDRMKLLHCSLLDGRRCS
jgi:hypothetical protein